ncbi:MAG TPA: phytanoyl-CoA dioxygenase family protein [Kiloniellaceae bacterium]|nr:phytanoyl-CoA dioxygenase family protein [Kiloniellaceae bacterium]
MNRELPRAITDDEIETYGRDGVVMLPGLFDADWIRLLDEGLAASRRAPTKRAAVWDRDVEKREMFYDSHAWQRVPAYARFVTESPCAELAGRLMGAAAVNFFFDAVFCRSPGTQFRTPWHQDEPYWSVSGFQTCSVWMPLVPVTAASAVAVVPGSHRWATVFKQADFGAYDADGSDVPHSDFSALADAPPLPDIDGDPETYRPQSFAMQPGDALVFNGRCIHGGSGRLADDRDLRVFNTKWCGDDVRVDFKPWGMNPDHSSEMTAAGLKPGDKLGSDLYPELWRRG